MGEPPSRDISPVLESLGEAYASRAPARIQEIEDACRRALGTDEIGESAALARLLVHRLAGTGTSYGFPALTEKAKTLDLALAPLVSGSPPIGPDQRAAVEKCLDELRETARGIAGSVRTDGEAGADSDLPMERVQQGLIPLVEAVGRIEKQWEEIRARAKEGARSAGALPETAREIVRLSKACGLADLRDRARALNESVAAFRSGSASPDSEAGRQVEDSIAAVKSRIRPLILSVDDDTASLAFLSAILTRAGHPVITASSAAEALDVIGRTFPDLILLDASMPDVDGYDLCARLQERIETACTPIVFVTALDEEQDRQRAFAVGATDYVVKPVDPIVLMEKVDRQLEVRKRWRTLFLEKGAQEPPSPLAASGQKPCDLGTTKVDLIRRAFPSPRFAEFLDLLAGELGVPADTRAKLQRVAPEHLYSLTALTGLSMEAIARRAALFLDLPYVENLDPRRLALGVLPAWFCVSHHIVCMEGPPGERAFILSNPFRVEIAAVLDSFRGTGAPPGLMVTRPENIEHLARPEGAPMEEATKATSVFVRSFVAFKQGGNVGVGEILEVSRDYVFVASDQLALVGSDLELRFAIREIGSSRLFVLGGKVVSLRKAAQGQQAPTGMGIRLFDLAEEDRHWLEEYVSGQAVTTSYREGGRQQEIEGIEAPSRYQIIALIGKGGTSEVYKALDREINDLVALKVFRVDLAENPDTRARMYQEIRLARKIRSEHVAMIYEYGTIGTRDYLTMEFVPGEALSKIIAREGPLPRDRVLGFALDVLDGISAAHRLGIIHRDLKPANVIVTPEGKAVVLDFGLAMRPEDPHLTRSDLIMGTPAYMAPESLSGGPTTAATDVYSFGCVLFEMLAGHPPFQASNIGELVLKKLGAATPSVRDLNQTVSEDLSRVVSRCMSREPADRYSDASRVAAALKDLKGRAAAAPAPPPKGRILVGTTDPEWASRLQQLLESRGFRVDRVEDGYHLMEIAFSGNVAGVFVDLQIPKIDGIDVVQILRSRPETADVPIALVSDRKNLPAVASLLPKTTPLPPSLGTEDLVKIIEAMGIGLA